MPLLNRSAHSKATLGDCSFFLFFFCLKLYSKWCQVCPITVIMKSHLKTYLFCSVYQNWPFCLITVHMCMIWHCYSFVDGLSWKCINVYIEEEKQVKLINYYCLPILLLLYIMLYVMVAYLMLFAALSNAVCLYNAFFAIDFCKCFLFSCFVLVHWHIVCLFQVLFCIMHSAFNLLAFPNPTFTPFFSFYVKGLCVLWRNSTYE